MLVAHRLHQVLDHPIGHRGKGQLGVHILVLSDARGHLLGKAETAPGVRDDPAHPGIARGQPADRRHPSGGRGHVHQAVELVGIAEFPPGREPLVLVREVHVRVGFQPDEFLLLVPAPDLHLHFLQAHVGRVDHGHADNPVPESLHGPPDDLVAGRRVRAAGTVPAHQRNPVDAAPAVHLQQALGIPLVHDVVDAGALAAFVQHVGVSVHHEYRLGPAFPRVGHNCVLWPPGRNLGFWSLPLEQASEVFPGDPAPGLLRDLRVVHIGPGRSRRLLGSPGTEEQPLIPEVSHVPLQAAVDLIGGKLQVQIRVALHQTMHVALLAPVVVGEQCGQTRVPRQAFVEEREEVPTASPPRLNQGQHPGLLQHLEGLSHHLGVQRNIAGHQPHRPHVGCFHCLQ